ncbi:MAG: hypothetical protein K2N85_04825, partial [Lachnospiraceae bacterium]|nr:hypothetical protein [Lachnospiraceae bacterium]
VRMGKFMYIRFQEENLQEDLEDYFEVGLSRWNRVCIKLEEIEKNKSFRLIGIYENLGRTCVERYSDYCYIQFDII